MAGSRASPETTLRRILQRMGATRAGWVALAILVGCGDARSGSSTSGAPPVGSAQANVPAEVSAPAASMASPALGPSAVAASPSASAAPSAAPESARPIADWLLDAAAKTKERTKPFAFEGIYRRTSLHQSGHFVGGEHPGHQTLVVYVADSLDAQPIDTLECWTALLTMPTDLREGDRIRVEGQLDHRAVGGPRMYLPYLGSCKYTRL